MKRASSFAVRLDDKSGVPVYRQIMDQIAAALAAGKLRAGDQLPTVRQLAVDLSVNPNTIIRAYRELEIRGVLDTQQGTGTFISEQQIAQDKSERQRVLAQMVTEMAGRAGAAGFSIDEIVDQLTKRYRGSKGDARK